MALITDARAVAFVKEKIRRRAEMMRALKVILEDDAACWNNGISAMIPNTAEDTMYDGRDEASVLTGADVWNCVTRGNQLLAVLQSQYAMDVIYKACMRNLELAL
jgi:hypothetical protein